MAVAGPHWPQALLLEPLRVSQGCHCQPALHRVLGELGSGPPRAAASSESSERTQVRGRSAAAGHNLPV